MARFWGFGSGGKTSIKRVSRIGESGQWNEKEGKEGVEGKNNPGYDLQ